MFIAIIKTIADLDPTPAEFANKSPNYPLECAEGPDEADLTNRFPGKQVMSVEAYKGYKQAMNEAYENAPALKSWWKFFGIDK